MTPTQSLKEIQRIVNLNHEDVELKSDMILAKKHEIIINGHGRGWIRSGYRNPKELLAWLQGLMVLMPLRSI